MAKKTITEINDIRDKINKNSDLVNIYVHMGTCGIASGATEVLESLKMSLKENNYKNAKIIKTGCAGICSKEPLITVAVPGEEPVIYEKMDERKAEEVVNKHIIAGSIVKEYAFARGMESEIKERKENKGAPAGQKVLDSSIPGIEEIPFFNLQEQRVMRNRGLIDPNNIEHYIGRNGYQGMIKALTEMTSEDILNEVANSGIRGRGGAGFPTGLKWKFASQTKGSVKYVLCNADEGDPGAYMDRSVLESDPHSILEGMVIAGKAIGSHDGFIYCRAEYPLAVEILNKAIKTAEKYNLLGEDILGTGFDFNIKVYEGAGAFVCGEETALMRSIEGARGNPRPRPPFPAVAGLNEKPTTLNNVETLSNIPQIIEKGSSWFSSTGTEKSPGTKVFSITGDINNVGCVEIPIGTKLSTIVNEIGGGLIEGKRYKAAQLG